MPVVTNWKPLKPSTNCTSCASSVRSITQSSAANAIWLAPATGTHLSSVSSRKSGERSFRPDRLVIRVERVQHGRARAARAALAAPRQSQHPSASGGSLSGGATLCATPSALDELEELDLHVGRDLVEERLHRARDEARHVRVVGEADARLGHLLVELRLDLVDREPFAAELASTAARFATVTAPAAKFFAVDARLHHRLGLLDVLLRHAGERGEVRQLHTV